MINKLKRILSLLDYSRKKKLLVVMILVFLGSVIEIFSFGSIIPLVDIAINDKESFLKEYEIVNNFLLRFDNKLELLLYLAILICIIFSIKNIFLVFLVWFTSQFTNNVRLFFNSIYLNQVFIRPFAFHLKNDSSKILRDSMNEINAVIKNIIFPSLLIILDIVTFLGLFIILTLTNYQLSIFLVFGLLIFAFSYIKFFKKKLNYFGSLRFDSEKKKIKTLIEALRLIKLVNIKNKKDYFLNKYLIEDGITIKAGVVNTVVINSIRYFLEILMVLFFLLLVFFAYINNYDLGKLLTYLIFLGAFFVRLLPSYSKFLSLLNNYSYFQKTIDNIYKDISEYEINLKENKRKKIFQNVDFKSSIGLSNVNFYYDDRVVLKNIDLKIEKNKTTVISGDNGAGKSTLINILTGLLLIKEGKYLLDDKEFLINEYDISNLFGFISQEIHLLDENIIQNIAFGESDSELDKNSINEISKTLEFDGQLLERIKNEKFLIGENGQKLSGGQRQKIVLARALYKNPEILVLDEPTSAFDQNTKNLFIKLLNELKGKKTFLIITHDDEIKKLSDKNYTIYNGGIKTV